MAMTRVFFATDVHGSEACFRKFLNAAAMYKANIAILSGDITGKLVIPIIFNPDNTTVIGFNVTFSAQMTNTGNIPLTIAAIDILPPQSFRIVPFSPAILAR
jgi:predicted phosphodiesterase